MPPRRPNRRPHVVRVHLTREAFVLAKQRMVLDGLTWELLLNASVSAYVLGELRVSRWGEHEVIPGGDDAAIVTDGDDLDAVEVDLDQHGYAPARTAALVPEVLTVRDLAQVCQERTGRRVAHPLLRELLRARYGHLKASPKARWKFDPQDPVVDEIVALVADGELVRLRNARLNKAGIEPNKYLKDFQPEPPGGES